ncbi:hypothetical protein OFY17_07675 [Marinomonas sp. C2222]|uniref:Uncharacterized protein n=1 Tax=Marinomonas sargassi TaxID=2984494 RepID=A0ABT2YS97_9GAMM|nr:hypothetical protein [Marinomonas sargassi]MCV2402761.1 hypothetical protein [Marinomonas sargassi]
MRPDMNELSLGASADDAECIFLLPNKPLLPEDEEGKQLTSADVAHIIELNGNHWRKIFTIMAKLASPSSEDWRQFRDLQLLEKVRLVFCIEQLEDFSGLVYLVGNSFKEILPVNDQALAVGEKHTAYIYQSRVWCPYLDYRQFPNILVESLREHLKERPCLHR